MGICKDERSQWILDNLERFQKVIIARDYLIENGMRCPGNINRGAYELADQEAHNLALSFLLVLMGEHIPVKLWSVGDYSELYGVIFDEEDNLDLCDD